MLPQAWLHKPVTAMPRAIRPTRSGREAGIQPVRLAQQGRPGERAGGELEADLALLGGHFRSALGRVVEIVAGRQSENLRLAGALEKIHPDERFPDRLA